MATNTENERWRRGLAQISLADLMTTAPTTVANLTAASGTADGTVADVGAAFSQSTLNDNFQELATKLNALLTALRNAGLIG